MIVTRTLFVLTAAAALTSGAAAQSWGTSFVNETSSRLVLSPSLQYLNLEKDVAWGDFDQDGDIDLAVMMKFPGSVQGGFPDVLLMNENGSLVDRTDEYAIASDTAGDLGFKALVNDRDVKAVDINGDGWLDLLTCTTMSDQVNATLGQPRCYINLGDDAGGNWLGFRFEDARIPVLTAKNGSTANPRFCEMTVADFTGDGFPDIFFVDYDTPETSGNVCIDLNGDGDTNDANECQSSPGETATKDYDNKFLVNYGNSGGPGPGFFFDTTNTRFTTTQLASAFGNSVTHGDFNGDGYEDVCRISTLTSGQNAAILYAKPADLGNSFNGPDVVYGGLAPYAVETADLNNDGKLDLVVADDSQDRYLLNAGNGADGYANFTTYTIGTSLSEFGNAVKIADLDNDGKLDVMIADVDADLPSFCPTTGRRAHIYRNQGTGGANLLVETGQIIPNGNLAATFDFAPVDLNADGWLDMVICRCSGIEIWMNHPPLGVSFSYPSGLPASVSPDTTTDVQVNLGIIGGGPIVAGSEKLNYRLNGGSWSESPLVGGPTLYTATLPALACGDILDYYFSGKVTASTVTYTDPPAAPSTYYTVVPTTGQSVVFSTEFEAGADGWTASNGAVTNAQGAWTLGDPVGTTTSGVPVSPENDNSADPGVNCWMTGLGAVGGAVTTQDLDAGPVWVVSPSFATSPGTLVTVSYAAWVYCNDWPATPAEADPLTVQVSHDGGATWTTVRTINTTASTWQSFTDSVVATGSSIIVRAGGSDTGNNSNTELGLDSVKVIMSSCETKVPCVGDLDADGSVGGSDLATLLGAWGSAGGPADLDGDGSVGGSDLATLLGAWGICP